jgi:dTDP-4-amino-4,6-dideoxygalactose transaminase
MEVAAFEQEFAAAVGAPYACAVSSCTAALHLALQVVGVGLADEVITVSHSFIATSNAIRYVGAEPVFIDIDPLTFNLDPHLLESAIGPKTRAILCVHQMGMPCDLEKILDIARRHHIPVIEDAACAAGSEIRWRGDWQKIGRPHADIACFSFHPRKILTTGEGGLLTTANRDWDQRLRRLRQHSMSTPANLRHGARTVAFEHYGELGYNYRMTDMQAAMGREQIKRLPELVQKRRVLAKRYCDLLSSSNIQLPHEPEWARSNWQSFCVRLPHTADQKKVMQALLDQDISSRRGIMCAHREAAYRDRPPRWPQTHSERAQDQGLLLPLYHAMSDDIQVKVATALIHACQPD